MSPRGPSVKGLVPQLMALLGGSVTNKIWDLVGGYQITEGVPLRGTMRGRSFSGWLAFPEYKEM